MSEQWRILVVEGEEQLNWNIVTTLQKDSYFVRGVTGGAEAIRMLWSEEYDIVLLQEPWTAIRNSRCLTKTHPAYDTYSPIDDWDNNDTRPRVMTYVRKGGPRSGEGERHLGGVRRAQHAAGFDQAV